MTEENKKSINKNFIISGVKVLSFIIVFVLILEILSGTIFSKSAATKYKNKHQNAYAYTQEVENSIQIVAIGNSDLYSAFMPVKLWSEYGYTSTVIASPRQTVMESYTILLDVLKTQSPKVVIIETDMLYNGISVVLDTDVKIENKIKDRVPHIPYLTDDALTQSVKNHFSVFMLHDRWKTMLTDSIKSAANNIVQMETDNCEHGYFFSKKRHKSYRNNNMKETDTIEAIPQDSLTYLDKIYEVCQKEGIQLVLAEVPSLNSWSYPRHSAVMQYAQEKEINFVDLNMHFKDLHLNVKRDFRDKGNHLNYAGARKATMFLGEYLNTNYSFVLDDNRDNPDYAYWHDDVETFIEKNKITVF